MNPSVIYVQQYMPMSHEDALMLLFFMGCILGVLGCQLLIIVSIGLKMFIGWAWWEIVDIVNALYKVIRARLDRKKILAHELWYSQKFTPEYDAALFRWLRAKTDPTNPFTGADWKER